MLNKSTPMAPCQSHRLHKVGRRVTDILHDPDGGAFVQNRCAENPLRQGSGQVLKSWLFPVEGVPAWQFYLRLGWIAAQLTAVYYLSGESEPFFYQGF